MKVSGEVWLWHGCISEYFRCGDGQCDRSGRHCGERRDGDDGDSGGEGNAGDGNGVVMAMRWS